MNKIKKLVPGSLAVLLSAVSAPALAAQIPSAMAGQSLRPYWHVFIAYAIAITVVLGWVISIGRRMRQVEERLGE